LAKSKDLDLIQVTEKVEPPICKFADMENIFTSNKRRKEDGKAQGRRIKEIRLTSEISP
jgi:translation initiation factor IF-3